MAMANLWNSRSVSNGAHQISATLTTLSGPQVISSSFTVTNVPCPRTCCVFEAAAPGHFPFTLTLNEVFADFDCAGFPSVLSQQIGAPVTAFSFSSCIEGSVVLSGSMTVGAGDTLLTLAEAGLTTLPVLGVTFNGQTANLPNGSTANGDEFPLWAIIAAAAGGAVLLIVIIIVIVCLCKRRGKSGDSSYHRYNDNYTAMSPVASTSSYSSNTYAATNSYPVANAQPVANANLVRLRLLHSVLDKGESILPARQGSIVFCEAEEWAQTSDWLWVEMQGRQGYVPRNYCQRE